jgi:hypothetical protein
MHSNPHSQIPAMTLCMLLLQAPIYIQFFKTDGLEGKSSAQKTKAS